jgi:hypothetical protein
MPERIGSAAELPEARPIVGWAPVAPLRRDSPDDPIRYTLFSRPSRTRFDLFPHVGPAIDDRLSSRVVRLGRRPEPPRGRAPEGAPQTALPPPEPGTTEPTTVFEAWS